MVQPCASKFPAGWGEPDPSRRKGRGANFVRLVLCDGQSASQLYISLGRRCSCRQTQNVARASHTSNTSLAATRQYKLQLNQH